jgi:hypothetical protein
MGEKKVNCWEFKKCGREEFGNRVHEMGPCPAAKLREADGFLEGENGGRACAYITGTFCSNSVQGTHREKEKDCGECDFYKTLQREHRADMTVHNFLRFVGAK